MYEIGAAPQVNAFAGDGKIISIAVASDGSVYLGRQSSSPCGFMRIKAPYEKTNVEYLNYPVQNKCGIDIILLTNTKFVYAEARNNSYGFNYRINILNSKLELQMKYSISHIETLPVTHFFLQNEALYYSSFNK